MRAAQASAGDSAQVSRPRISAARLPGERLCIRADGGDATCFLAPPAAALWRGGVGGGTVVWGAQFPRELPPLPGHARGSLLAGRWRRPRVGTAGGGSASPIGWGRGSTPDCDPKGDPEPFGVTCPHNAVMPEAFTGSE